MRLFKALLLLILGFTDLRADTLDLQVKGQKLSLPFWPGQGKQQNGGVLIVAGEEVGDPEILSQLGQQLAKHGWSALLFTGAGQQNNQSPWVDSLTELISALRQKSNKRTILLYHGPQLQALLDYFTKLQAKQLNGLILLSAYDQQSAKGITPALKKLSFPIYDVIGQFDYGPILEQASLREKNAQNQGYRQLRLPCASHDYIYTQEILVNYLYGWMMKLPADKVNDAPPLKTNTMPVGPPVLRK